MPKSNGDLRGTVVRRITADTSRDLELRQGSEPEVLWAQYTANCQLITIVRRELKQIHVDIQRRKHLARLVEDRPRNRAAGRSLGIEGNVALRRMDAHIGRKTGTDASEPMSQKAFRKLLMKAKHDPSQMKWAVPTRMLANATRQFQLREGEELLLTERTILSLTGTARENSWIHHARGRCEIQACSRPTRWDGKRKVCLYGSSLAKEATKEYLLAQDARFTVAAHDSAAPEDVSPEGPGRWVPSRIHSDADTDDAVRADELPAPEIWSVRTFAQYVEDLCAMRLARAKQQELYSFDETFQQNVAAVLERLFTNNELKPHISSYALNLALEFSCKHSELGSTRELLYFHAKQLGLHRQIWMYNLLIERALKTNEIDTVGNLVKDMHTAGVVPNGLTWAKLLLVVHDTPARRHLLDYVLRVFPDDFPQVKDHFARRLIQDEMPEIAQRSDGYRFFVDHMDKALGPTWLTSETLNRLLYTCGQHKLWEVATNSMKLAFERGVPMTSRNITAMINFYYQKDDLQAAIDLLRSPWVTERGYHSEQVIPRLFFLAWSKQRWNVCRALWQYAASRGLITYQMQMRVHSSLKRNKHLAVLPPQGSFGTLAGKLVIGTDLDTAGFGEQFPRLSRYFSTTQDPIQWLAQWTPNNGIREEQMSLAYVLINRDLMAWKVLKPIPKDGLPELLNAARRKDQAWVAQKFDKHATLAEMLANAIQMPLRPAEARWRFCASDSPTGKSEAWELNELGNQVSWTPLLSRQDGVVVKIAMAALSLRFIPENLCSVVNFLSTALREFAPALALSFYSVWSLLTRRLRLQDTHGVA